MCVVSMVGDEFPKHWAPKFPQQQPFIDQQVDYLRQFLAPTREEFDALKKEVELMKKLLIAAKLYDEKNSEPNCEMEGKVALLKAVAKAVGVDLEEVFGKENKKEE